MVKISKYVINLKDIPLELRKNNWVSKINVSDPYIFVEAHISGDQQDQEDNELDKWILSNYPELKNVNSFLIQLT
jgi:uncharacterized pyridoxamine 5'-phosphate oxidase family protein